MIFFWGGGASKINKTNSGKTNQIKRSKLWQLLPNFLLLKKLILNPDFLGDTSQPKNYSRQIFSILKGIIFGLKS